MILLNFLQGILELMPLNEYPLATTTDNSPAVYYKQTGKSLLTISYNITSRTAAHFRYQPWVTVREFRKFHSHYYYQLKLRSEGFISFKAVPCKIKKTRKISMYMVFIKNCGFFSLKECNSSDLRSQCTVTPIDWTFSFQPNGSPVLAREIAKYRKFLEKTQ